MLFNVGRVNIDREVLIRDDIEVQDLVSAFGRFINGDWGELEGLMSVLNDVALTSGEPVVAAYTAKSGASFWITRHSSYIAVSLPEPKPTLSSQGGRASCER